MLPAPLQDLALRVAALDGEVGDRVSDAFTRLVRAAEAMAWARERLPGLVACASEADVLGLLAREAGALTDAPEVWAVRWTGGTGGGASLCAIAGRGSGEAASALGDELRAPAAVSRSLVARVLHEGRPAWSDDARAEAALRGAASILAASLRSVGCLPVGRHAVLYLADASTPARFDAVTRARLAALCETAAPFLDRRSPPPAAVVALPGLVGTSVAMRELAAAVRAFAPMPWPALVLGETGTGKEAVARALHACSSRKDRPFQAINCGAIPDELAESLLFGHEKGAFTGADRRREGVVEAVGDGTLFLDEVGELSPRAQVKLLRLLQEGTYTRVGGDRELRFGGRVVAATHRPVDVPGDAFRADLYHRLAACVLRVPPLRDRRDDIPALAHHLVARALGQLRDAPPMDLDADAARWLQAAEWPGNVRELENTLRGAIARALARGSARIGMEDVGPFRASGRAGRPPPREGEGAAPPREEASFTREEASFPGVEAEAPAPEADRASGRAGRPPPREGEEVSPPREEVASLREEASFPGVEAAPPAPEADRASGRAGRPPPREGEAASPPDLAAAVDAAQRAQVLAALAACGGNKSAAAKRLGVSRQWLHKLLERWGHP